MCGYARSVVARVSYISIWNVFLCVLFGDDIEDIKLGMRS